MVTAIKHCVTLKFAAAWAEVRKARWDIVVPALLGMVVVVAAMAGVMRVFVEDTPQLAHALFFGMVLASVVVPVMEIRPEDRHTGAQKGILAGLFAVAAVAAFFLTGLGAGSVIENPPAWMIFGSAAIAICALVLPGISGSFMLKIFGLYVPTMAAVADRNFGYLALSRPVRLSGSACSSRDSTGCSRTGTPPPWPSCQVCCSARSEPCGRGLPTALPSLPM